MTEKPVTELSNKIRPGLMIDRNLWEWFTDFCETTYGRNKHSWKIECMIEDLQRQDKRSPVDVERRKVVAELAQVTEKLKLLHNPDDEKYVRSRKIIGWLTNKDPKYERGPFADVDDIDELRFRAVEEFRKGAAWAKEDKYRLNVTSELEIDRACDWAADAKKLLQRKKELEAQNDGLRAKTAERTPAISDHSNSHKCSLI